MDAECISLFAFWIASAFYAFNAFGLDESIFKGLNKWLSSTRAIVRDFRSAKYYNPWKSSTPIIVTSRKHIAELSEAPGLSQRAVYADMFGFKHTMNGIDHHEVNALRSRLYGRLIQVQGQANLPRIYPYLHKRLCRSLDERLHIGRLTGDGISLPVADTARVLASCLMRVIFFGESLSSDPAFADALLQYPKEMVSCLAAFQVTPSFASSFVHSVLTRGGKAQKVILDRVTHTMGAGFSTWDEESPLKELTLAYNMVDLTKESGYWQGPAHLAQSLLGIWFAAAHQPWMNLDFIILSLCVHPEWQTALCNEIGDLESLDYHKLQNLPLLDSFIKETVRLHPLDTYAVRRKALQNYQFSNGGPFVPCGATVCISAYDKMHDPVDYPSPNSYRPRRFVDIESPVRGTRFTDVSEKFPTWGFGSLACPGRFHASIIIKLILAHLVCKFELKLEDEKASRLWSWETFTMPYESTRFILKQRT